MEMNMDSETDAKTALERLQDPSERVQVLRDLARNKSDARAAVSANPEAGISALVLTTRGNAHALSLYQQSQALEVLVDLTVNSRGDVGTRDLLDDSMSPEEQGRLMAYRGDRDSTLHHLVGMAAIVAAINQILNDGVAGEPMVHSSIYGVLKTHAELYTAHEYETDDRPAPTLQESSDDAIEEMAFSTDDEPEEPIQPAHDARGRAFSIETVERVYEFLLKVRTRNDFESLLQIQVGEHQVPVLWYALLGVWANSCPTDSFLNMSKALILDLGIEVDEGLEVVQCLVDGEIPPQKGMSLREYLESIGDTESVSAANTVRGRRRNLL